LFLLKVHYLGAEEDSPRKIVFYFQALCGKMCDNSWFRIMRHTRPRGFTEGLN